MSESLHWSQLELEAIVQDYLAMLSLELCSQAFNKSAHNAALISKLNGRTKGSVEYKHQNISAAMLDLRLPYIAGYRPMANYQGAIIDVICAQLGRSKNLLNIFANDAASVVVLPETTDILKALKNAPKKLTKTDKVGASPHDEFGVQDLIAPYVATRQYRHRDYLAEEAANQALGQCGEEFILDFERARLRSENRKQLADKIEHVSSVSGDGAGYDIKSFETNGAERLIEVKTTKYGEFTPFFVSRNEVKVSRNLCEKYYVYRLYTFKTQPRFFIIPGSIEVSCELNAITYQARLHGT